MGKAGLLFLSVGLLLAMTTAAVAQTVSPEAVGDILQKGGAAAFIALLWWQLREEKKKNERLETERAGLLERVIVALNTSATSVTEAGRALEKLLDKVDELLGLMKDILRNKG